MAVKLEREKRFFTSEASTMTAPKVMVTGDGDTCATTAGQFSIANADYRARIQTVTSDDSNEPIAIPITGELDLHTFRPAEVRQLLNDYFAECLARGLRQVRVIHGKGTGTLRETVHAHLRRSPLVTSFALGDETSGGWGATRVTLCPRVSKG